MITIDHMHFELIENYRDAFDEDKFVDKYSEVLNKYDYIVGDIGYEKLRLAGFFRDNKAKAERDKKFSAIEDYLFEYCNFGCAYFVVRKITKAEIKEMQERGELPDPKSDENESADAEASPEAGGTGSDVANEESTSTESKVESADDTRGPADDHSAGDDTSEKKHNDGSNDDKSQHRSRKKRRGRQDSEERQKQNQRSEPSSGSKTLAAHESSDKDEK